MLVCGMLIGPCVTMAQDSDADRSHPKAFVKDSTITTKIKTQLACRTYHQPGAYSCRYGQGWRGVVERQCQNQEAIDKAMSIARETEGVKDVHNHIKIKKDD